MHEGWGRGEGGTLLVEPGGNLDLKFIHRCDFVFGCKATLVSGQLTRSLSLREGRAPQQGFRAKFPVGPPERAAGSPRTSSSPPHMKGPNVWGSLPSKRRTHRTVAICVCKGTDVNRRDGNSR
jgi:hypothetical protein